MIDGVPEFLTDPPSGPELRKLGSHALYLAECGFEVFPLHHITPTGCSCEGRRPGCTPGKHPRTPNGFKDATTDPGQIESWWGRMPYANIGIRTDRLFVVDIDPDNGGVETWAGLVAEHGQPDPSMVVLTGDYDGVRGRHLYFGSECATPCGTKVFGEGVDLRADDGYVVGPGSLHESLVRYRIETVR